MEVNWLPLENKLGRSRCVGFMYMGRINGVHLYKHGISRTYIHLDDAGNCYIPLGKGGYARTDWEKELALLENLLEGLGANLETPTTRTLSGRRGRTWRRKVYPC